MPRAKDLCVPSVWGGRLATPPQSKEEEQMGREGTQPQSCPQHHSHRTVGIVCTAGRQQLNAGKRLRPVRGLRTGFPKEDSC